MAMSSLSSFLCSNTVSVRATPRSSLSQLTSGKKKQLTIEIKLQRPRHPPRQAIQLGHGSLSLDKVAERVGLVILPSRTCAPLFPARPPTHPRPASLRLLPWRHNEHRREKLQVLGAPRAANRGKASFRLLRSATLFLSGKAISCLCPL